jgi:hypothetical protein
MDKLKIKFMLLVLQMLYCLVYNDHYMYAKEHYANRVEDLERDLNGILENN